MEKHSNKKTASGKRPTIFELQTIYEEPFIPPNLAEHGCSPEEYVKGRERVVVRRFMRHIARMIISENLKNIPGGV